MVPLPPGKIPINYQWIYKIKSHSDGSVEPYKYCLIAWDFFQEYDIAYEIFALEDKMTYV